MIPGEELRAYSQKAKTSKEGLNPDKPNKPNKPNRKNKMKVFVTVKHLNNKEIIIRHFSTTRPKAIGDYYAVQTCEFSNVPWIDQLPGLVENLTGFKVATEVEFSWDFEACGETVCKGGSFDLFTEENGGVGISEIIQTIGVVKARRLAKRECKRYGLRFVEITAPSTARDYRIALLNAANY